MVARARSRFPYLWNECTNSRVGLLPGNGDLGKMQWFDAPSCFVFHFVNAYESDGRVIANVIRHTHIFGASDYLGPDEGKPVLVRWTFDLARGLFAEAQLDDHGAEFPRFDTRLGGQPYRFCYSARWGHYMRFGPAFKHDVITGSTEVHDFGPGRARFVAAAMLSSGRRETSPVSR